MRKGEPRVIKAHSKRSRERFGSHWLSRWDRVVARSHVGGGSVWRVRKPRIDEECCCSPGGIPVDEDTASSALRISDVTYIWGRRIPGLEDAGCGGETARAFGG
jgi:hypothetical protein